MWTYTRQEGDLRVAPLVIACAACDTAAEWLRQPTEPE